MKYVNNIIITFFLIVIAINIIPVSINAQSRAKEIPGTISLSQKQKAASNPALVTAVGLQQFYSSTGHYTVSADGIGSLSSTMNIRVNKPNATATVQKAVLITSRIPFTTVSDGCVAIEGVPL